MLSALLTFQEVRATLDRQIGNVLGLHPFQTPGPDTLIDLWRPRRVVDSLREDHFASPQKESLFKSLFGIIRRGDTPMEGWQNWRWEMEDVALCLLRLPWVCKRLRGFSSGDPRLQEVSLQAIKGYVPSLYLEVLLKCHGGGGDGVTARPTGTLPGRFYYCSCGWAGYTTAWIHLPQRRTRLRICGQEHSYDAQ